MLVNSSCANQIQAVFSWVLITVFLFQPVAQALDPKPAAATTKTATTTVDLTIDFGDGFQRHYPKLDWKEGMTVFTALELAGNHKHGFKIVSTGKADLLLVTAIDEQKNEGSGKNWLYEINSHLGDSSSAVAKLKGGDTILWRFGTYE